MTDTPLPEADEADVLEQEAPVDERPPLDTHRLDDRPIDVDEADLLEQSQSVPADPDEVR